MKWTREQKAAIDGSGQSILVSASAGSGKTSIMIERIATLLLNKKVSPEELLILTFTVASARDMKTKLRRKLSGAASDGVSIGTFHKFCANLVRANFNVCGIDPGFSVMDETRGSVIKGQVLDDVIAHNYLRCQNAVECFCANRNTGVLKNVITDVSDFLNTRENRDQWIKETAFAGYENDLGKNIAMQEIIKHYKQAGEYFLAKFEKLLITARAENAEKAVLFITECIERSKNLDNVSDYAGMNKIAGLPKLTALNSSVGRDFSDYQSFKDVREKLKKMLEKISEQYVLSKDRMLAAQNNDRKIVGEVVILVSEFEQTYAQKKAERNELDFADLEKYAVAVLQNGEVLSCLKKQYKYIFIDEYQDTNPVQEKVLRFLSGDNVFMVGDVKQSIYAFRGCESSIFTDKMKVANDVVLLNSNFRSDPEILDFVNKVFSKIMREATAGIDYKNSSEFVIGEQYPKTKDLPKPVEVILVDTHNDKRPAQMLADIYDIENDRSEDDEVKKAKVQAAIVAKTIFEIHGTQIWDERVKSFRTVKFSDIAVLSRNRTNFGVLTKTLHDAGIDCVTDSSDSAAGIFEIAVLNNMLLAASNFYNDSALVLTMQSFVFGFSADELARIAVAAKSANQYFFQKISEYIKNNKNGLTDKLKSFVNFLEKYNALSKGNNVVDVLSMFIAEYNVIEKLLGKQRIYSFLNALRGKSYAQTVAGYLFLLENGQIDIEVETSTGNDSVRIMTMHSAKGLEFPVVIIFDAGTSFSTADARKYLVPDKTCGLCVFSSGEDEFVKTNSIARLGAVITANRAQIADEMRLLYVACTRAMNRLVIVAAGNADKTYGTEDFDILTARSFLDFLMPAVLNSPYLTTVSLDKIEIKARKKEPNVLGGEVDKELVKKLRKNFDYKYSHKTAVDLPVKSSVSSLTKREEDFSDFIPRNMFDKDRGAQYGTQFHKAMQHSSIIDDNVKKCMQVIEPLIKGMTVYRELPFLQSMTRNEEPLLVQGVIDLLAVDNGRAVLVDYKTTFGGEQKLRELYTAQLEMYAEAVKQALELERVEAYIYSTHLGKLLKV